VLAIDPSALDTFARAVRDTLRSAREERGDTQLDVAGRLNLTVSALSKLETGAARVDLYRLATWCLAVGIEPIAAITIAQLTAFPGGWPQQRAGSS
jgi:transcriptional regulator with XRE-family HTH domain